MLNIKCLYALSGLEIISGKAQVLFPSNFENPFLLFSLGIHFVKWLSHGFMQLDGGKGLFSGPNIGVFSPKKFWQFTFTGKYCYLKTLELFSMIHVVHRNQVCTCVHQEVFIYVRCVTHESSDQCMLMYMC